MANTIISINHPSPFNLGVEGASRRRNEALQLVIGFLRGLVSGTQKGTTVVVNAGTATTALANATGTITLSSATGTLTATINGVAVTASAGASDTLSAAALATAINASTNALVRYLVAASSAAGVVTIYALQPGITGNCITLAASAGGGTATASGARLTGGAGGSNNPVAVTL